MTGGGAISPKYFRAMWLEITDKVRYYGWKIREGEALRMDITRNKKGFFHSNRKKLSQWDKQAIMDGFFCRRGTTDGHFFGRGY